MRLSSQKLAIATGKWYNTEKQKQSFKLYLGGTIENKIHPLLNCPVYKDLRVLEWLKKDDHFKYQTCTSQKTDTAESI